MKRSIVVANLIWALLTARALLAADPVDSLAEANNKFAFDLFQEWFPSARGNIFYSPYSIETALAMTLAGARGETASQMNSVLHLADLETDNPHAVFGNLQEELNSIEDDSAGLIQMKVSNGIWKQVGDSFSPGFLNLTMENYDALIEDADFRVNPEAERQEINSWVEERTENRITELIKEGQIKSSTAMAPVNAIYLKAPWFHPFDLADTTRENFYGPERKEVDMMNQEGIPGSYLNTGDAELVSLSLTGLDGSINGGNIHMMAPLDVIFVLPKAGGVDVESFVRESFDVETFSMWMSNVESYVITASLPRFRMEFEKELNDVLKSLGMVDAFDREVADFSGMTGGPKSRFVSLVKHKAFLQVNEEGAEAAAATAVVTDATGGPLHREVEVVFDRTFFVFIRERSHGTILFMGYVEDPGEVEAPSDIDDAIAEYFGVDSVRLKQGYAEDLWIGTVWAASWPWILHDTLGWCYCSGSSGEGGAWLWSVNHGWIWTGPDTLPTGWV